jgi:hypothetical protein
MMTKPDSAALFSVIVADLPRSPTLGAIFYDQGPGATLKRLTEYLRAATERSQLQCREPLRAARLFLGAVVYQHHLQCLIGGSHTAISEAEISKHVREAVAMFLARYGSYAPVPTKRPKGSRG